MDVMRLVIPFLCAAFAFPAMLFERVLPLQAAIPAEKIVWEHDRTWFHNQKNYWTEFVRAAARSDAQWWGKFTAFKDCTFVALIIVGLAT